MVKKKDKATLGLTDDGAQIVSKIEDLGLFDNGRDIAKFAIAVAINNEVEPTEVEGTDTTWHARNFDNTGDVEQLIQHHYSDIEFPYRAAEGLIEQGLQIIESRRKDAGGFVLTDYL